MPANIEDIRRSEHYTPPAPTLQAARSFDMLLMQAPSGVLVRGPYPLPDSFVRRLNAKFSIPEGYTALCRHDQRPWALLEEGRYNMLFFPYRGQVEIVLVDTRERTLPIKIRNEFSVDAPASDGSRFETRIDLDLAVLYCVRRPELTAQNQEPLVALAQEVTDAVSATCRHLEQLNRPEHAGRVILTALRRHKVELLLGIEVLDVRIEHVSMLDVPMADPAAEQIPAAEWKAIAERIRDEIREIQPLLIIHSHEDTQQQLFVIQGVAYSNRGEQLQIDLVCNQYYPTRPPRLDVQLDGIPQHFPALYKEWQPDLQLIDLVQAIIEMHE